MQNISSEQELKQLLEEEKISREEYLELKRAMAEKNEGQTAEWEQGGNTPNPARKLGKIALILVLSGIVFPAIIYNAMNMRSSATCSPAFWPFAFIYFAMEIAGLVLGIISWKSGLGKAAAITAGILMVMSALSIG